MKLQLHCIGILRKLNCHLPVDLSIIIELLDCLIHTDHTRFSVGLHNTHKLMRLSFTDQISHRMICVKYLKGCHTPKPVRSGNQLLGNNSLQYVCQLHTQHRWYAGWKEQDVLFLPL